MKKWIQAGVIGVCLFLAALAFRDGFSVEDGETFLRLLCDAFLVPGVLLTGSALLKLVSGQGAFDALSYSTRKVFDQLRREENRNKTAKTYYDYVTEQRSKKRSFPAPSLFTGLFFLAASVVTLAIYMRMYP